MRSSRQEPVFEQADGAVTYVGSSTDPVDETATRDQCALKHTRPAAYGWRVI